MTVKFSTNILRLIKYLFLVQALWNLKQINHSETTQLSFSFLKKFLNIPSSSLVLHLNVASRILELVINNHILYSLHPIYVTFTFFMFFILFSRSLKWVTRWLFFFSHLTCIMLIRNKTRVKRFSSVSQATTARTTKNKYLIKNSR